MMAEQLSISGLKDRLRSAITMTDDELQTISADTKKRIKETDYSPERQAQLGTIRNRALFELAARAAGDSFEISFEQLEAASSR